MSKLPALHFYVGDWRKSTDVQSLSYHDRGVWMELLCFMHESEDRGKLVQKGRAIPDEAIFRLLGLDNQIGTTTLTTLVESGVADRDPQTGALMSRRMVRDEKLRKVRSEVGKLGGNPNLLNQKQTTTHNQIPEDEIENEDTLRERGAGGNPTLAEVQTFCQMGSGIPPECGEAFFNSMEGCGWIDRAQRPVRDWRPLLRNYANTWRANNQKDKSKESNLPTFRAPRPPTITELIKAKDTLETQLNVLKNRYGEGPLAKPWTEEDKQKRAEYRKRINELNNQIAKGGQ